MGPLSLFLLVVQMRRAGSLHFPKHSPKRCLTSALHSVAEPYIGNVANSGSSCLKGRPVCRSSSTLAARMSRTQHGPQYLVSVAVLLTELMKLTACVLVRTGPNMWPHATTGRPVSGCVTANRSVFARAGDPVADIAADSLSKPQRASQIALGREAASENRAWKQYFAYCRRAFRESVPVSLPAFLVRAEEQFSFPAATLLAAP